MSNSAWCVYILECVDGSLYTGVTLNLVTRIKSHQTGKGAKYTRSHLPVKLVYAETALSQTLALQREIEIKRLTRDQKLKLIGRA